jgi:hypothetical protein
VVRVNEREYVVNRSNGVEGMTIFDDRGARIASFPRLAASPAKTRSGNGSSGFPRPVEGAANDRLDCGFGDSFVDLGNWGFEDYLDPSLLREEYWADEIFPGGVFPSRRKNRKFASIATSSARRMSIPGELRERRLAALQLAQQLEVVMSLWESALLRLARWEGIR